MNVLVVNVGGVTLELSIVDEANSTTASDLIDPWDGDTAAISQFVANHPGIAAVGHRVVHGGRLNEPVIIDDDIVHQISEAAPLSPVHQERAVLGIAAARAAAPEVPHIACFDTSFHRTIPDHAATYALPAAWRRWPLRRRGFHGLSHQHVATNAARIAHDSLIHEPRRIVSCHLGSGASVCAILDGASIDTTMGATPLEGLVMTHRSGTVDPGIILWLIDNAGLSAREVADGLYHRAGLAALAGGSGDMRDIIARRDRGDHDATLAFDVYLHRLRAAVGSMAASLGGIDILAFTGGIGEHMSIVRNQVTRGLEHLGIAVRKEQAEQTNGDLDITAPGATTACVVVATSEHLTIAAATRCILSQ